MREPARRRARHRVASCAARFVRLLPRFIVAVSAAALAANAVAVTTAAAFGASAPAAADTALARRIIEAALASDRAAQRLAALCDTFGPRLSGSPEHAAAAAWALAKMKEDGLANVRAEPVMVPHWVRGEEWAEAIVGPAPGEGLAQPLRFRLTLLGLGGTVGTPPAGIEGELLIVSSFDELEQRGSEAAGRIVLFDQGWEGYGKSVAYRSRGAQAAAKQGAIACLIRAVTGTSLATPHTGVMRYAEDPPLPRIPAAALTLEDAGRLHRLSDRGIPIRVRLGLGAQTLPAAQGANLVAELPGSERPDAIVLLGGHFDSWDVGTGAMDDGAGCIIAWEAIRLLRDLGLTPRCTLRLVLFADEEQTQAGAEAYAAAHADELACHVAALESDSGWFRPVGFSVEADSLAVAQLRELLAPLLEPLEAAEIGPGGSGVDVSTLVERGVVGIGHRVDSARYFDYHHSPADTFDKVDGKALAQNVAAMAIAVYALANEPAAACAGEAATE